MAFYQESLENADNKDIFKLVKSLEGERTVVYPEFDSVADGCNQFDNFLRIHKIRRNLSTEDSTDLPGGCEERRIFQTPLDSFRSESMEDIH